MLDKSAPAEANSFTEATHTLTNFTGYQLPDDQTHLGYNLIDTRRVGNTRLVANVRASMTELWLHLSTSVYLLQDR